MEIVGYCDKLSVRAGEKLSFHVSSHQPKYTAAVVRLIHGDENPAGPGFKAETIGPAVDGALNGEWRDIPMGSFMEVSDSGSIGHGETTFAAWVYPTLLNGATQTIAARRSPDGSVGWRLMLDGDGHLALDGDRGHVTSDSPVPVRQWLFVSARLDGEGDGILDVSPRDRWPSFAAVEGSARGAVASPASGTDAPFILAGEWAEGENRTGSHFNGRISDPRVFDALLSNEQIEEVKAGGGPAAHHAWDFSSRQSTLSVPDTSGGADGRLVRMPMRAVGGHRWDGSADDFRVRPDHYTAVHFHEDDREDAEWPVAFELDTDPNWRSGVYAVHLVTENGEEDYVPFFVRPAPGAATRGIAFLAPTFSYLAYGNEQICSRISKEPAVMALFGGSPPYPVQPQDKYVVDQGLISTYDLHTDGSGGFFTSHKIPVVNMRPKVNFTLLHNLQGSPHQFNADLHLIDWLEAKGFGYDVMTDHDLHAEGIDALSPYKVILTGTHPEYWSTPMLDALKAYLDAGGRLMYLGGNGFYWVTTPHPEAPHVIELRKWEGNRAWQPGPGEFHHQSTGELGGLWRGRGRAPNTLVGVGFGSEGFDTNQPYARSEASYGPEFGFIFEGVEGKEIGDVPNLVMAHGAAGFEMDRHDPLLGSPPDATVLASSSGHSDFYLIGVEDIQATHNSLGGQTNPNVRADMAYLPYPNDGAVFSTGSISWCGCLSHNDYENDISRITENVLRRFAGLEA